MPTRINKARFDAFVFDIRRSGQTENWIDVAHWETHDGRALAALFYVENDEIDGFVGALFLRDQYNRFSVFPPLVPFRTKRAGERSVMQKLKDIEQQSEALPVPDSDHPVGVDLFTVNHQAPLNPIFLNLRDSQHSSAAREIIRETAGWFVDRDGNFARDFQTTGTSARFWELYLFRVFRDLDFEIDFSVVSPDFALSRGDLKLFVEATTANSVEQAFVDLMAGPTPPPDDFWHFIENDMAMIFGSPLYSKQKKAYWEKAPVKGNPFAIAIADFHAPGSMTWSHTALSIYLYGVSVDRKTGDDGQEIAVPKPILEHRRDDKVIPTGFFDQPGTEHISAVVFSNAGTKAKFTRMGTLAGFGEPDMAVRRVGIQSNPMPGALDGLPFNINIEAPEYEERWPDEVEVYHNPNAVIPWPDESVLPELTHFKMAEGELVWRGAPFRVLTSRTLVEQRPPFSDADRELG